MIEYSVLAVTLTVVPAGYAPTQSDPYSLFYMQTRPVEKAYTIVDARALDEHTLLAKMLKGVPSSKVQYALEKELNQFLEPFSDILKDLAEQEGNNKLKSMTKLVLASFEGTYDDGVIAYCGVLAPENITKETAPVYEGCVPVLTEFIKKVEKET